MYCCQPQPTHVLTTLAPDPSVSLGTGVYPRADAARLLGMPPARLRRWVGGYTYWLRRERGAAARTRRQRPPLISTELPPLDGAVALTFLELMELRVVQALVGRGVTLQHVRAAARLASRHFDTRHPFASRRVFTDGRHVFSAVTDDTRAPNVVEWTPGRIEQVVAGPVFDQFLAEIEFDAQTALAERWWPLGRAVPVVLDPRVSFGAPVVAGTGVRTSTVARFARHASTSEAAVAYELALAQAEAAVSFEEQLAAA